MNKQLVFTLLCMLIFTVNVLAQYESINYQGVALNAEGDPVTNQISLRISIVNQLTGGTSAYTETHSALPNSNGLFSIRIGEGAPTSGDFSSIDWSVGRFLQVEMDVAGGSNYTLMGTSQLVSVPYAILAQSAENVDDADADATNELSDVSLEGTTLSLTNAVEGATGVDLGEIFVTDTELEAHTDGDFDDTNEIQDLSISNGALSLSNDPTNDPIDLTPFLGTNTDDQELSLDGTNLSISGVLGGNSVDLGSTFITNDDLNTFSTTTWNIGGVETNGVGLLGTTNENDVSIITNGIERLHISSVGNVGVGRDNPLHLIHADGNSIHSGELADLSNLLGSPIAYEVGNLQIYSESNETEHDNIGSAFRIIGSGRNYGVLGLAMDEVATHNRGVWAVASGAAETNRGLNGNAIGTGTSIQSVGTFGYAQGSLSNLGIQGTATGTGDFNYGAYGIAQGAANNYAFYGVADEASDGGNYGIRAIAENSTTNNIAVIASVNGPGTNKAIAIDADATGSNDNVAIDAFANGSDATYNTGVQGTATGGNENYGVKGWAHGTSGTRNVGGQFDAFNSTNGDNVGVLANSGGSGVESIGVLAYAGGASSNISFRGFSSGESVNGNTGISAEASSSGTGNNLGVYSRAVGDGIENRGGFFDAFGAATLNMGLEAQSGSASPLNIGVRGGASQGDENNGFYSFINSPASIGNWGIKLEMLGSETTNVGIEARGTSTGINNYGGDFEANGASDSNYGVRSGSTSSIGTNYGLNASATGSTDGSNYGIRAIAENSTTNNIAIQAQTNGGGTAEAVGVISDVQGATTNIAFRGQSQVDGEVNLGAELKVQNASVANRGLFIEANGTSTGGNEGILVNTSNSGNINRGVVVNTSGSANDNFGVYSSVDDAANISVSYEGYALSSTGNNYGSRLFSTGSTSGTNYGIWVAASNASINYAGYFDGDVHITGTLTNPSDRRLKKNIATLSSSLENVMDLRGVTFAWKDKERSQETQLGLIAQELEKIYPELVFEKNGSKEVNYIGLIPVLLEAIKEQQKQIQILGRQLSSSKEELANAREFNRRLQKLEALLLNSNESNSLIFENADE